MLRDDPKELDIALWRNAILFDRDFIESVRVLDPWGTLVHTEVLMRSDELRLVSAGQDRVFENGAGDDWVYVIGNDGNSVVQRRAGRCFASAETEDFLRLSIP